jgi:hypothetical protein
MTALMSSLELMSSFAEASAELLAAASLSAPQRPLGSAVETAILVTITLSKTLVHSTGVKFCLLAIAASFMGGASPGRSAAGVYWPDSGATSLVTVAMKCLV